MTGRYRHRPIDDSGFLGMPEQALVNSVGASPMRGLNGISPRDQSPKVKPLDMAEVLKDPSYMNDLMKLQELMRHPGFAALKSQLLQASTFGDDQNARALLGRIDQHQQLTGATGMTGTERYAGVVPENRQIAARPQFNPFG